MNTNPYQAPEILETANDLTTDAEQIRSAHIKHEASVKSVGSLYIIGSVFIVIACLIVFLGAFFGNTLSISEDAIFIVLLPLGISQFVVGLNIMKLKSWVKLPVAIFSIVGLLGFPLGTLINIYILYLFFCAKGGVVLSNDYKAVIEQTPHIKYKSKVIWIALILMLSILCISVLIAIST